MRLLRNADYMVANWNFGKNYPELSTKELVTQSLIDFVQMINILHKYKIIIPDEYDISGSGTHKINLMDKESYNSSFWEKIASNEEYILRIYFLDCDAMVQENGELIACKDYVKVFFNTPLNEEARRSRHKLREINGVSKEVSLTVELMADDWLPYRVIDKVTRNDDFEYNHSRLKSALTEIEKLGYSYYSEDRSCISVINGFDLDCVYYEDEICLFDDNGVTIEGVKPEDVTNL